VVEFNDDDGLPRIRDGWTDLREHYGLKEHHNIFFRYLGQNLFHIIPMKKEIGPHSFPTWHTGYRSLQKPVNFKFAVTEDPLVVPYLVRF
jgi:hypothetical protein